MHIFKNKWYEFVILKNKKFLMLLVLISLAVSSYLGYLTPRLIAQLYQSYGNGNVAIETAMWALGIVFVCEYINQAVYQLSINKYMQHLIQHARSLSFSNWIRSYEAGQTGEEKKYPLGEILARIMSDTDAMMEMVGSGSFKIFIDVTYIASCLVSFLTLNTTSGLFLIGAEVLACAALLWGSKYMAQIYAEVRKANGAMARSVANLTGGTKSTYYTPNKDFASNKSLQVFDDFLRKQLKANVWDASYFSIAESLFPLLLVLLVIVFPYSRITEMAVLAAIIDLIQRSINPIKEMSSKVSSIQRARAGLMRILEFNHDIQQGPASSFEDNFEQIDFQSLIVDIDRFQYPGKEIVGDQGGFALHNIHLQASRGELVGIVGLSGSGKSTLLKILASEILCQSAKITITTTQGQSIHFNGGNFQDLAQYKHQVSIISQDSHVFSESLKFNITLGQKDDASFDRFWSMVTETLPYIQKWGITPEQVIKPSELSMGQKQLVSALRSCYLTKPIVLFDEISSGLDSDLEESLRTLVLMIQKRSLTIIVAHRIETIVKADHILVMDGGTIKDKGNHQQLMNSSATYQEFISQLRSLS